MVLGAVYSPVFVIVPSPVGVTVQFTAAFEVPDIVALNCCVWLRAKVAVAGLIMTPGNFGITLGWNRSDRSEALQAFRRHGPTPNISCMVRRVELWS
jgi:hypothetical protein